MFLIGAAYFVAGSYPEGLTKSDLDSVHSKHQVGMSDMSADTLDSPTAGVGGRDTVPAGVKQHCSPLSHSHSHSHGQVDMEVGTPMHGNNAV